MNLEKQSSNWVEEHYQSAHAQRKVTMVQAYEAGYLQSVEDANNDSWKKNVTVVDASQAEYLNQQSKPNVCCNDQRRLDTIETQLENLAGEIANQQQTVPVEIIDCQEEQKRQWQTLMRITHRLDQIDKPATESVSKKLRELYIQQSSIQGGYQAHKETYEKFHDRITFLEGKLDETSTNLAGHIDAQEDLEAEVSNMKRQIEFLEGAVAGLVEKCQKFSEVVDNNFNIVGDALEAK